MTQPLLHFVGGPTASGKSALALSLAEREQGTVINADSMQIYGAAPCLTAQPSAAEKSRAPHLLYGFVAPDIRFSVGKWLAEAEKAIRATVAAGRTPVIVGGTGLYFKALEEGLAEVPEIDDAVREETVRLYDALSSEAFRAKLAPLDPESATRIKPNDRQRLIRAFEVAVGTGRPLSFWQSQKTTSPLSEDFEIIRHRVLPERADLYARCDARFLQMMEQGALEEVRALLALNLADDLPAMKILGVPELAAHLKGEVTLEAAITKAQQATRNYAKRQVTWFKHQWPSHL